MKQAPVWYSIYLRTSGRGQHVYERDTLIDWRRMNPDAQSALRDERFRDIVRFAYRWVPFYRRLYKRCGVDVDAIHGIEDAPKLPVVTREEMQAAPLRDLRPSFLRKPWLIRTTTDGGAGQPLRFFRSLGSHALLGSQVRALFTMWQINTGRKAMFLLHNDDPTARADLSLPEKMSLFNRYYSVDPSVGPKAIIDWITNERPDLVVTHPSVVELLTEEIIPMRGPYLGELVFAFEGEPISDRLLARIRQTFPVSRVYRLYRAAEIGLVAAECIHRHGMHVLYPTVYMEEGTETPYGAGAFVRPIVTSLMNYGTPFIRYAGLNDLVRFASEDECRYFGTPQVITEIAGRESDVIRGNDGRTVPAGLLFNRTCDILGVRRFQFVQTRPGQVCFRYIPDGNGTHEIICDEARKLVVAQIGDAIDFTCEVVGETTPPLSSARYAVRARP